MSSIGHARHHAELAAKREAKKTGTPYICGFCNPSNPRTKKYDPHGQCKGCECPEPCHQAAATFEAGFYSDVPEADYHSGKFGPVEGSLSHSGAKTILKAPALFAWEREHPTHRDTFDFGSAAHALVLGRGMESIYVAPYDDWIKRKGPEGGVQYTNDEKRIARADGLSPILPKDWLVVCDMAEALSKNTLAMELLARGVPEVSAYAVHEATGVWRRCRFDYLTDDNIGVDYKSADNADPADFGRTAFKLGYFMQDPFYSGVAEGAGRPLQAFTFIVQEKDAPYLSSVVELDEDAVAFGKARVETALERFRDCTASGIWPGYQADGTYSRISLPPYAFKDAS